LPDGVPQVMHREPLRGWKAARDRRQSLRAASGRAIQPSNSSTTRWP
jgi:hypothetical protein